MNSKLERFIFTLLLLLAAAVSPNLLGVSQSGYAKLSFLAMNFLIPSIVFIGIMLLLAILRGQQELVRQVLRGMVGGLLGTIGLEIFRHGGFLLGGMPGELPKLMGVLLLDRFALGPNALSNLAGWGYHFWNGAAFGIIYSLLVGRGRLTLGLGYGFLIGVGFMISPMTISLGVGRFGLSFGLGFPLTVTLAHLAFGAILGYYVYRKNNVSPDLFRQIRELFSASNENI